MTQPSSHYGDIARATDLAPLEQQSAVMFADLKRQFADIRSVVTSLDMHVPETADPSSDLSADMEAMMRTLRTSLQELLANVTDVQNKCHESIAAFTNSHAQRIVRALLLSKSSVHIPQSLEQSHDQLFARKAGTAFVIQLCKCLGVEHIHTENDISLARSVMAKMPMKNGAMPLRSTRTALRWVQGGPILSHKKFAKLCEHLRTQEVDETSLALLVEAYERRAQIKIAQPVPKTVREIEGDRVSPEREAAGLAFVRSLGLLIGNMDASSQQRVDLVRITSASLRLLHAKCNPLNVMNWAMGFRCPHASTVAQIIQGAQEKRIIPAELIRSVEDAYATYRKATGKPN